MKNATIALSLLIGLALDIGAAALLAALFGGRDFWMMFWAVLAFALITPFVLSFWGLMKFWILYPLTVKKRVSREVFRVSRSRTVHGRNGLFGPRCNV